MSSRVGTAIPASRSTALSSAALGLTRSTQTAPSGRLARSPVTFFSEDSAGTNTDSIENSVATGTDIERHDPEIWFPRQQITGEAFLRIMHVRDDFTMNYHHTLVYC